MAAARAARRVRVHDFLIPARGKAMPYGVYDLTRNAGWVSVGVDYDTATFAVRTIGRWWRQMGRPRYDAHARCLSRRTPAGATARGASVEMGIATLGEPHGRGDHRLSFAAGTSKWNKIEHRLFSYISSNWRGQPLVSFAVIVNLIDGTRTAAGLRVRCDSTAAPTRKARTSRMLS